MEVGISVVWHVIVEDNVNLLDIDASSENLSGNQDAMLELLESLVDFDPELG